MRALFLSLFLTLSLYAQNPVIFSALGDVIYNNKAKIENLKSIDIYKNYSKKIDQYVQKVEKTKKKGFLLDVDSTPQERKAYLNRLRTLAKTNDFFVHLVETSYDDAKEEQNSKLFNQLINTGLLDTEERKKEILDYYFAHAKEMKSEGVLKKFLEEDARLRAKRAAQRKRYKTKKEREAERIRLIREHDRIEKERLEKKLQEEFQKKKLEIREYQKRELSKTI